MIDGGVSQFLKKTHPFILFVKYHALIIKNS